MGGGIGGIASAGTDQVLQTGYATTQLNAINRASKSGGKRKRKRRKTHRRVAFA